MSDINKILVYTVFISLIIYVVMRYTQVTYVNTNQVLPEKTMIRHEYGVYFKKL